MTYDEAVALPDGSLVLAVQPCDGVEYTWVRNHGDKVEALTDGRTDARIMVRRPTEDDTDQHKFLFVPAAELELVE